MSASVVRWQIVSPRAEECAHFYSRLFGWRVTQDNALGYRQLESGNDRGIDGGIWPAPPEQQGFVQLFVEVPDIDACIATAIGLGGPSSCPSPFCPTATRWRSCSIRPAFRSGCVRCANAASDSEASRSSARLTRIAL